MIYPIYIPSKGRPVFKTFKHVENLSTPVYLVLEKEDVSLYQGGAGNLQIITLEKSNQGISYSRHCIKKHAEKMGYQWFWSLDDDIQDFWKTQADGKLKKTKIEYALQDAQEIITAHKNVAIGSLNFGQYAFGDGALRKPFTFNKRCIVCTLNNVEIQSNYEYDLNCKLKEDIDFSLQILTSGIYKTMICNQIAMTVPANSTLRGGCYDEYRRQTNERAVSTYLENKWGKNVLRVFVKKDGQYDVKINWDLFR